MFVVKYGVPVAGMMSHCSAMPERSSIVEPGEHRRVDPLVEVQLVAGVEEDPEERVAEMAVDDRLQLAADLADVRARAYHSATASKYGATSRST